MRKYQIVLLMILTVLSACRTRQVTRDTEALPMPADESPQSVFREMLIRHDADTTAYMKATGYVTIGDRTVKGKLQIRWRRDEAIQISILPPVVGVELCRVVLTRDSLYVIDRFHKQYASEALARLQKGVPFDVSFASIQAMLLASPFLPGGKTTARDVSRYDITEKEDRYIYTFVSRRPAGNYVFDGDKRACLTSATMSGAMATPSLTCRYADYEIDERGVLYPQCIGWLIEEFFSERIVLTFDKLSQEWNGLQNIAASVSSRYKKVDMLSWLNTVLK